MILNVGERAGEIAVLEINEQAGTVKFNNHGTEEVKSLDKDSAKLPVGPVAAPFPVISASGKPGVPAPAASLNPGPAGVRTVTTFGGSAGSTLKYIPNASRTLRSHTAQVTTGDAAGSGTPSPGTPTPQSTQPQPLTPEEQLALFEIQREMQ